MSWTVTESTWSESSVGTTVHNSHWGSPTDSTSAAQAAPLSSSSSASAAMPMCKFHANGGCTKGDECPFSHDLTVQASTRADADAGFVFVSGVANLGGSKRSSPSYVPGDDAPWQQQPGSSNGAGTPAGLNPDAPTFQYGPAIFNGDAYGQGEDGAYDGVAHQYADGEQHGYDDQNTVPHMGWQGDHGGAYYPDSSTSPVEFYPRDSGYGYDDERMRGMPAGSSAREFPQWDPSQAQGETPPTFTTRRRVPTVGSCDGTALDFNHRQSQAMRPPLPVPRTKANASPSSSAPTSPAAAPATPVMVSDAPPSSRPRPPLRQHATSATNESPPKPSQRRVVGRAVR